ncbi:MAG TPA: sigma 54-interacting transcriptional regulator [Candidatus Binatia bacterium]
MGQASHPTTDSHIPHSIKPPLMIGETPQFYEVLNLANRYAMHDITVLITGETGTGKEVMAQYVHSNGSRATKPFVGCNMTAIPETLVESELFGYVRGAFTGAERNKKGLIEAAEGGTLFLDEIGELAPAIQLKLLRFLETRQYYRVGESTPKSSDVRIVAATNKELEEAIQGTGFRKDLYFRLNSARIILPPLRGRKEDIILMVANFVYQACKQFRKPLKTLSSSAKALFLDYPWPGNIRELDNVLSRAVVLSPSDVIEPDFLALAPDETTGKGPADNALPYINLTYHESMEAHSAYIIDRALERAAGNQTKAAEFLDLQRTYLARLIKQRKPNADG